VYPLSEKAVFSLLNVTCQSYTDYYNKKINISIYVKQGFPDFFVPNKLTKYVILLTVLKGQVTRINTEKTVEEGFLFNYMAKLPSVVYQNLHNEHRILYLLYFLNWFCENWKNMQTIRQIFSFSDYGRNVNTFLANSQRLKTMEQMTTWNITQTIW
jgi:hypothetical protein